MEKQYCRHCRYEINEPVEEHFCSDECYLGYAKSLASAGSGMVRVVSTGVSLPTFMGMVGSVRTRKWT